MSWLDQFTDGHSIPLLLGLAATVVFLTICNS